MELAFFLFTSIVFNALSDLSSHGKLSKNLNMKDTWKAKWKNGNPAEGEKFLFSSTALVFLTDFFHLTKFLYIIFMSLAVASVLGNLYYSSIVLIVWCALFELFYRLFNYIFK